MATANEFFNRKKPAASKAQQASSSAWMRRAQQAKQGGNPPPTTQGVSDWMRRAWQNTVGKAWGFAGNYAGNVARPVVGFTTDVAKQGIDLAMNTPQIPLNYLRKGLGIDDQNLSINIGGPNTGVSVTKKPTNQGWSAIANPPTIQPKPRTLSYNPVTWNGQRISEAGTLNRWGLSVPPINHPLQQIDEGWRGGAQTPILNYNPATWNGYLITDWEKTGIPLPEQNNGGYVNYGGGGSYGGGGGGYGDYGYGGGGGYDYTPPVPTWYLNMLNWNIARRS